MNIQSASRYFITRDEYLEGEEISPVRHEYVNGRVYAMAGASDKHNEISFDTAALLKAHHKGDPCKTFLLDVKVEVSHETKNCYYYPDVFVTCEKEDVGSPLVKRHPKLVIEVLSPNTWRVDEGEKLKNYSLIPSVEEIILIAQDWPELVIHRRTENWEPTRYFQPDDKILLKSVNLEITLSQIYASIPFVAADMRPWYYQHLSQP